tara:strand:+ start:1132 stop:1818 length:687 start_codon:yes stop_codon:yes gene_type:complete
MFKNNGNIYSVEKASKGKAIKILKAFKGAQADANKGQAMSPGTGATGGTRGRGRDPSVQSSGNNNLTQKNKDALTAQNKGARAAISPSTTTGNKVASAAMNFVLPGSGYLYNKSIDARAMGYKPKVTTPPINTGGGNNNSSSTALPIVANKPIDPNLVLPKDNFFNFKAYKVGGLSGGVRYGPPPKRGPNPNVPPIKMKHGSKKEIKAGYHKMPDGSIMKNSAHKGSK